METNRSRRRRRARSQEGAVMLIVMLILLMGTATAVIAIRSSSFELRAAGHMRRTAQADYIAESGLVVGMGVVDAYGAADFVQLMNTEATNQAGLGDNERWPAPYEPAATVGRPIARLYLNDAIMSPGGVTAVDAESVGTSNPYIQQFTLDIYDVHEFTGAIAGQRSDGQSELRYMRATYTSRGRVQLMGESHLEQQGGLATPNTSGRFDFEAASDARAQAISGPYGAGG